MKWIKLIRFINKHRKAGCGSFKVVTKGDTFIIWPTMPENNKDQLRISQKFWRA